MHDDHGSLGRIPGSGAGILIPFVAFLYAMTSLRDRLVELAPHYILMILLMFLALAIVEQVVGALDFWPSLAIALLVAIAYPIVLRRLGRAPEAWQ